MIWFTKIDFFVEPVVCRTLFYTLKNSFNLSDAAGIGGGGASVSGGRSGIQSILPECGSMIDEPA